MKINSKVLPLGGFGWAAFATLVDEYRAAGKYEVEFSAFGGPVSGIRHLLLSA